MSRYGFFSNSIYKAKKCCYFYVFAIMPSPIFRYNAATFIVYFHCTSSFLWFYEMENILNTKIVSVFHLVEKTNRCDSNILSVIIRYVLSVQITIDLASWIWVFSCSLEFWWAFSLFGLILSQNSKFKSTFQLYLNEWLLSMLGKSGSNNNRSSANSINSIVLSSHCEYTQSTKHGVLSILKQPL